MDDSEKAFILPRILIEHPTAIVGAFAIVVAVLGIFSQRKTSKEKNSLEFQADYLENKDIQEAWLKLREVKENKDPDKFEKLAKQKGTEERKAVLLVLNEWERAANAIHHGLYDANFLYQAHGTTVITLYKDLLPFIKVFQKNNARYFIGFTKLAVRWQHKRALEKKKGIELTNSVNQLNTTFLNFNTFLENHPGSCPKQYNFNYQLKDFVAQRKNFRRQHRKLYLNRYQRFWASFKETIFKTNP